MSGIAATRIQVSMFGTVQSIVSRLAAPRGAGMQVIIDVSRQRCADAGDFLDVRHARPLTSCRPPKWLSNALRFAGPSPTTASSTDSL